jgi:hypothetical protein
LFAFTNSPSKTLNIQSIGAVQAINALSVDLYADWNHCNTWPIGGPAGGMRINFSIVVANRSKEVRGFVMSKTLAGHWLALMLLLMLTGYLGGCCSGPQGDTRDFWDKQESVVKPGGA